MDGPLSVYLVNSDACIAFPAASTILANLSFTGECPTAYSKPVQSHHLIMDI